VVLSLWHDEPASLLRPGGDLGQHTRGCRQYGLLGSETTDHKRAPVVRSKRQVIAPTCPPCAILARTLAEVASEAPAAALRRPSTLRASGALLGVSCPPEAW
jgi:thiol-disulfide isomerase/thioredoxin